MDAQKVIYIEELLSKHESITSSIQELSEDEKKELLRNSDFVSKLNSMQLEFIINSLNFMDAFNMLQNKDLVDRIRHVNVKLKAKDAMFVKDFIDLIPDNKIHPEMAFNMLRTLPKDEVIKYLRDIRISQHIMSDKLIELAVLKRINIFEMYEYNRLDENEAYIYVDKYIKNNRDFSIMENKKAKKAIFGDEDINLDEVRYLYEYLATKTNHSIKEVHHSLDAFMEVYNLYKENGLNGTLDLINTSDITIDDLYNNKKKSKKNKKTM